MYLPSTLNGLLSSGVTPHQSRTYIARAELRERNNGIRMYLAQLGTPAVLDRTAVLNQFYLFVPRVFARTYARTSCIITSRGSNLCYRCTIALP